MLFRFGLRWLPCGDTLFCDLVKRNSRTSCRKRCVSCRSSGYKNSHVTKTIILRETQSFVRNNSKKTKKKQVEMTRIKKPVSVEAVKEGNKTDDDPRAPYTETRCPDRKRACTTNCKNEILGRHKGKVNRKAQ